MISLKTTGLSARTKVAMDANKAPIAKRRGFIAVSYRVSRAESEAEGEGRWRGEDANQVDRDAASDVQSSKFRDLMNYDKLTFMGKQSDRNRLAVAGGGVSSAPRR